MNKKGDTSQKNQRIQVFARCRPLNTIERKQCSPCIVEVVPEKKEIIVKDRTNYREFYFDKVFQPDIKQIDVYKSVVEPLIQEVLMGYNCTVFAYGQTGTGKTYTMEGERNNVQCSWEDDPGAGIIPRSLHQLFEELNKGDNVEFSVRVSFLELYNEELFDLLSSTELSKLRLFEDSTKKGSVIIQGLEEIIVNSKDEVYAILEKGTARRQTAATMLNATSSRSHTVFSVTVHIKENTIDGEELLKTGKLNLVDLAGSENVGRSGAIDKRAREAGNINQSLLTLGRVITSLIEKQPHVPYRESKLTRLLQDSLGGHTKTSIIATVSPAHCNLDETISTLDYATKAKSITIKPEVNQKMTKRALIREYTEEIERLRKDLTAARSKEGFYVDADNYMNFQRETIDLKEEIKHLTDFTEDLKQENSMLEQYLSTTKEELYKKSQDYEDISLKLMQTTETLRYTQLLLSKTALMRDEKAYLLNAHSNTEKNLTLQAHTLLQVINETTDDVDKLQNKLDRKRKVELINDECSQNFKRMYHQQFANLEDLANKVKSQQFLSLGSINDDLDQFVSGLKSYRQKSANLLHSIISKQNDNLDSFSTDLSKDSTEQKILVKSMLEDFNSKENKLSKEQQTFLSSTFSSFINQQNSILAEMENWMLCKHSDICQKINKLRSSIKIQSATKADNLKAINVILDTFFKHHDSLLVDLKEKTQSLSTLQAKLNENIAKKKKLLEELSKQDALMEATVSECRVISQNLEYDVSKLADVKKPLQTLEIANQEDISHCEALDDIENSFKTEEYILKVEAAASSQKSIASEVTKFVENNQKHEKSSFDEIKESVMKFSLTAQTHIEKNTLKYKEMQESLSEWISSEDLCLQEYNKDLLDNVCHTVTIIEESEKQLNDITTQLKQEIIKRDVEFEKFIHADLQKDIPTGTTPQRKTYDYPKTLAATSPDDRLLHKLHLLRNENTNKAVNLPLDSSFDDSDEFKSPLNPNESTVVNTSFNSEEEYSTGCETVSNASSVSDLSSVDSLTNKENRKKANKFSQLPKLKKSKKLEKKLAFEPECSSTKRQPLVSKNP